MYQSVTFNPCCHYNKFTQSVSRKTTYNLYTYSSYSCKTKPLHSGFGIFCGVFYLFLLRFYCFLFILMNGNLDKTFVFIPLVIWIKNTRCPSFYSGQLYRQIISSIPPSVQDTCFGGRQKCSFIDTPAVASQNFNSGEPVSKVAQTMLFPRRLRDSVQYFFCKLSTPFSCHFPRRKWQQRGDQHIVVMQKLSLPNDEKAKNHTQD